MSQIEEEEYELKTLLIKISNKISSTKIDRKLTTSKLESVINECNINITQCNQLIKRIEIESRDMSKEERQEVRSMLKDQALKLKELKKDIKWLNTINTSENDEKYQNENNNNKYIKYSKDNIELNENELINYGINIQNKDINILDNVIKDLDNTKNIASNVAERINEQTTQMNRIDNNLNEIDTEMHRAKKILRSMARRLYTDKIVWFLLILILIAIVIVILRKLNIIPNLPNTNPN